MRARLRSAVVLAVVATGMARGVEGQSRRRPDRRDGRPPAVWLGLSAIAAIPQGDFAERVDQAFGGQLDGSMLLPGQSLFRLRGELGFLVYGHEHREVCFGGAVGCRIGLDVDTDNTIFFGGFGPEVALPGDLSPYANGSLGFSYFNTASSLGGSDWYDGSFAHTEHFGDAVLGARAGAGLRVQVTHDRAPIAVDFGAQYHWNGTADYLVEGDVVDAPDGGLILYPNRSEVSLVAFHVGVSVGLPHGGKDRDDDDRGRRPRGRR